MVFCLWNGGLYLRGKFTFATHEFFNCWTPLQNCPYCEKWTLKSGVTWQMAKDWKSIYLHWTSIDYSNPVQFEDRLEQSKRREGAMHWQSRKKGKIERRVKVLCIADCQKVTPSNSIDFKYWGSKFQQKKRFVSAKTQSVGFKKRYHWIR